MNKEAIFTLILALFLSSCMQVRKPLGMEGKAYNESKGKLCEHECAQRGWDKDYFSDNGPGICQCKERPTEMQCLEREWMVFSKPGKKGGKK